MIEIPPRGSRWPARFAPRPRRRVAAGLESLSAAATPGRAAGCPGRSAAGGPDRASS